MAVSSTQKLNVFLYFAQEDKGLYKKLENHLMSSKWLSGFSILSNDDIPPGDKEKETLERFLNSADLVLFLFSADFLAGKAGKDRDVDCQRILKLQHEKRSNAVFIYLRPCTIQEYHFDDGDIFPHHNKVIKAITQWGNEDEAYEQVCKEIREKIRKLRPSWDPKRKLAQVDYEPYEREELKRKIEVSRQAILANPRAARAYLEGGRAHEALKRYKKAIGMLNEAIKLNPNEASAYLYKAEALYALRRFEKALESLNKYISLNAYNPVAFLFKGMALYRLRRHKEAISVLRKAIELDPSVYYTAAFSDPKLRELGHFEDDISALKSMLLLTPYNIAAVYRGGSIFVSYAVPLSPYAAIVLLVLAIILLVFMSVGGARYEIAALFCPKKALLPGICSSITTLSSNSSTQTRPSPLPQKPAPTPTTSASMQARNFMQKYYGYINNHDYSTAYLLWQDNITGHGEPYDKFVADYSNTKHDDATVTDVVPNKNDKNDFDVTMIIVATEQDGKKGEVKEIYHAHYIVGVVADGSWMIIEGDVKNSAA